MTDRSPRVSIGLPVYNGQAYLTSTLDSLLGQDFEDFELIVSDNASTDATQEICRAYARRDRRIRYYRNSRNLGAAPNYNRVFKLARGALFKWAPHDDLYRPSYLRRCVETLDEAGANVVLCYPHTLLIDEAGHVYGEYDEGPVVCGATPSERLSRLLSNHMTWCHPVVGLIRTDVLKTTKLIGSYPGADHTLLAELALRGEFREVPERLFLRRTVQGSSPSLHATPDIEERAAWFDTNRSGRLVLPRMRLAWEHVKAVCRAPIGLREKHACLRVLRTTPFAEYWSRRMLFEELRLGLYEAVWERYSVAALRSGMPGYLPHRLWALMSGIKRRDAACLKLAVSLPSPAVRLALLQFVVERLSRRKDAASRELLDAWYASECELHHRAAASLADVQRTRPV